MRWNARGPLVPIVVSAVVSAGVAVVVTEVVAPPSAGAAAGVAARAKKPAVSLATLNKTVTKDFGELQTLARQSATATGVAAVQAQLTQEASKLATLNATVAALQAGVSTATSDAGQAQTLAASANAQLTALTPIVKSTAERVYDTCGLTSDLWQRSFPSQSGNGATAWTQTVSSEANDGNVFNAEALGRCYSTDANAMESIIGAGIIPQGFSVDDAFTAPVP
jgi:outer membrane murein-binding lipoprotein Lpp